MKTKWRLRLSLKFFLCATILGGSYLGYWISNNRPIPGGCVGANEPVWINPPSDDEIKSKFLAEHPEFVGRRDELFVICEKTVDQLNPARYVFLIGYRRRHEIQFKGMIYQDVEDKPIGEVIFNYQHDHKME